ncbi:zinc finger protein 879-like isoform X1 [Bombus pascuorum]|uniref:zinc finger protein 879-like isoform X1 n=1 Tax=Bombus pascuorum TaxID=65598 RepID=UPI00298DA4F2|nr:zinc finger protein 879-like isoform X1 [Bombus pascuorum]
MSSLDYLDLCRLCLVKDRVSVPIFEGEGDVRQIFLKIAACLPVKLTREDKLPKKICDDCVYKVELFYQFWNTTANAEKQLLQWLGEVSLEDKQGYVTNVLNTSVMKQEQNSENRLDGNVMQQVGEHQNNMGMAIMDNMGLGIPMMISNANQQQITSVPMDTNSNTVQTVQAVPGPSSQTTHNQIPQNQTSTTQQEDEEESSEDDENSDEDCDGDEGLPVKEESEEDPSNRTIEPTTFVNVSLACDEAGPSGLQQQKITDMPEMPIPQPTDGDPKSGRSTIAETSLDQGRNDRVLFQVTVPASSPTIQNYMFLKVEVDHDENSQRTVKDNEDKVNDSSCTLGREIVDDSIVDSVKTVLVPVRDPVTKEVKNMLVPVEVRDESGLNLIKSVLIPFPAEDGSMSYEIKKVIVPIKSELSLSSKKKTGKRTSLTNKAGSKQVNCKKKEKKENEEKQGTLLGKRARSQEREKEEQKEQKIEKETEKVSKLELDSTSTDVSKEEVDQILDNLKNICPFCQKCFRDEDEMQKHVLETHKKPYSCDKCHKSFFSDFTLEEHQKTHDVLSFYQCSVCQKQYKTATGLKNHQTREHSDIDPKFKCYNCKKQFKLKLDLNLHIHRSHMNTTYICRFCGKEVKNIVHHELKHEKNKKISSLHHCSICSRKFKAWNSLENHLLLKHKAPKEGLDMLRTLCEKKFQSRSDFYHHVLSQSEAKQHKCVICDKTFASEHNLRSHVALHSQTCLCSHCGKTFTTNYSLKLHLRKHTGERPYQCKICLKTFARSNSLKIHTLTHTGERPYVCDLCGQSFTQRGSMMTHRRKHRGSHPLPAPSKLNKLENNEH